MISNILLGTAFAVLLIGTVTDFRKREVPDWVNYSGIVAGLGIRLIYSAATFDWRWIFEGMLGFGVFFAFALLMFYLGQWGGGDSKMIMGLGALLGLELRPDGLLISFFVNLLFIGAAFGIMWSIYLAIKSRKKLIPQIKKTILTPQYLKIKYTVYALSILSILASFISGGLAAVMLISGAFLLLMIFYAWVFMTSVEKVSMIKDLPVEKLTEGDWIVNDVKVDGKRICGPKDLGISRQQIAKLMKLKEKGKIKSVMVKEGMPFVPVFLISLAVTSAFGNLALMLI